MTDIKAWLNQISARLEAVKKEPAQEDRDREAESRAWSDLYQHAPDDLTRAHHIITRMVQVTENHPDPCDKHPEGDVITCGWKNAYKSVTWALKETPPKTTTTTTKTCETITPRE